ncbi:MAG TPA: hypothetical protein VFT86_00005, partial [Gaiellaceae bacterium]|nr:hypothetical protein [Gaiellaceae bacterium]
MQLWRWFVGQVARLRRSIVGVPAFRSERGQRADDHVARGDEHAPGPPAHWVERVRRGAPGLLEPALRRGGPAEPPAAERIALPQTELEPEPESLEKPELVNVRPEPPVAPQRPEAPVRTPPWRKVGIALIRKVQAPLLRNVHRRTRSHPAARAPRASVDVSRVTAKHGVPHELDNPTRGLNSPAGPPAAEADRQRSVGETGRTLAPSPNVGEKPERFSESPPTAEHERLPGRSEVVEHDVSVQRRTARSAPVASHDAPIEAGAPPGAKNVPQAEHTIAEIRSERIRERVVRSPAPGREAPGRLREPALSPPTSRQESPVAPAPPPRRRAEPLSEVDV